MKLKCYVDYDSTLNTLAEEWCIWASYKFKTIVTTKDIKDWYWMENTFGHNVNFFWKTPLTYSLDIVTKRRGAKTFLNTLKHMYGKDNVAIITHSWQGTEEEKDNQIKRFFGDIKVIHEEDKASVTKDGILIDDRPSTVEKHCKRNDKLGIVFTNDDLYGWSTKEHVENYEQVKNKMVFKRSYEDILDFLYKFNLMGGVNG